MKGLTTMHEEKDWQAESDADTLARANEISMDTPRLARARAAAYKREVAMKAVAKGVKVDKTAEQMLEKGYKTCG